MTSAQVVETSVKVTSNSPSQDYTHPDDHNLPTYDMTPGFKPFTSLNNIGNFPRHITSTFVVENSFDIQYYTPPESHSRSINVREVTWEGVVGS